MFKNVGKIDSIIEPNTSFTVMSPCVDAAKTPCERPVLADAPKQKPEHIDCTNCIIISYYLPFFSFNLAYASLRACAARTRAAFPSRSALRWLTLACISAFADL